MNIININEGEEEKGISEDEGMGPTRKGQELGDAQKKKSK